MESQVTWSMAVVVMALAAAHCAEQCVPEMRGSLRVPESEPWSRVHFEDLAVDRIGPLLLLAALMTAAVLVDAFWLGIALGIVGTDLLRHVTSSLRAGTYTAGLATAAACVGYLGWILACSGGLWDTSDWGAIVIGGAFVTIRHLSRLPERDVECVRPARRRSDCDAIGDPAAGVL